MSTPTSTQTPLSPYEQDPTLRDPELLNGNVDPNNPENLGYQGELAATDVYFNDLRNNSQDQSPQDFNNNYANSGLNSKKIIEARIDEATRNLQEGNLDNTQRVIEQHLSLAGSKEKQRDALAELHIAEKGKPSKEERNDALNHLKSEIGSDLSKLSSNHQLGADNPELKNLQATNESKDDYEQDYFNDSPEASEEKSPHQKSEDSHELLLNYIDKKLRDPTIKPEFVEKFRIARDTLHLERKGLRAQFGAQNSAIESVNNLLSKEAGQIVNDERVKKSIRSCRGDDLNRAQEMVKIASETEDPAERDAIINDLQNGAELAKDAEAFKLWQQQRADLLKGKEVDDLKKDADAARDLINNL